MILVDQHKRLGSYLLEHGEMLDSVERFVELIGVSVDFAVPYASLDTEEKAFRLYLDDLMGPFWLKTKTLQESTHYHKLVSIISHAVSENNYYTGETPGNSRRMIAQSSDCLSTLQIYLDNTTLHVFAMFRSTHHKKLLPADIMFLLRYARDFTNLMDNLPAFKHQTDKSWSTPSNIQFHLTFGSLHTNLSNEN